MLRLPFTSLIQKTSPLVFNFQRFFSASAQETTQKPKRELRLIRSKSSEPYDIKTKYSPEAWKGLEELYKKERVLSKIEPNVWHQTARDLGLTRGQIRRFFWYKAVEFGILNPDKWLPTIPKESKRRVSSKKKRITWFERLEMYKKTRLEKKQQKLQNQAATTPTPSAPPS